jgi:tRNA A58 N-methylase Trm61
MQRGKKRRWKENCSTYSAEALALHQQLLSKQKDADAFESRLQKLEAELKLLGIKSRIRLRKSVVARAAAAGTEQGEVGAVDSGAAVSSPGSATAPAVRMPVDVVVVDLPAARKALEAAAAEASQLGHACLKLDAELEALEVQQQQMLVSKYVPSSSTPPMHHLQS